MKKKQKFSVYLSKIKMNKIERKGIRNKMAGEIPKRIQKFCEEKTYA